MKFFLSLFLILVYTFVPTLASAQAVVTIPDEVIVTYKDKDDISVISVPTETPITDVIGAIEENPNVAYAEPNYTRRPMALSVSDPLANLLWGHDNTGQSVNNTTGTPDADMDIAEAWNVSTGTQDVIVGVIDTGVLYTHPDLANSVWDASSCVDDTGTTTTCTHGYNFADNTADPLPSTAADGVDAFHGTHVAGTIAASVDNGRGIAGVAPRAKIAAIRFGFDVASEVRAIDFATKNGIKIINASYGGSEFSQAEYDAISRFRDAGGIFIAAAGNSSTNNDSGTHNYPSDHDLDNIISVAATDQSDNLATFSSYGPVSVDIAAPGTNILSTYLNNQYVYANGTSMAAAYVTGLVAYLWSVHPELSAAEVRARILNDGDPLAVLAGKTVTGKRVNAYNVLELATTTATSTPPAETTGDTATTTEATSTPPVETPPVETPPANPVPPPPSNSGGGGGGGGNSSSNTSITQVPVALAGDSNADGRVDLLDFNTLMVAWASRPDPFLDFNSLMIHWTLA